MNVAVVVLGESVTSMPSRYIDHVKIHSDVMNDGIWNVCVESLLPSQLQREHLMLRLYNIHPAPRPLPLSIELKTR